MILNNIATFTPYTHSLKMNYEPYFEINKKGIILRIYLL
jgi:hypothetical protein